MPRFPHPTPDTATDSEAHYTLTTMGVPVGDYLTMVGVNTTRLELPARVTIGGKYGAPVVHLAMDPAPYRDTAPDDLPPYVEGVLMRAASRFSWDDGRLSEEFVTDLGPERMWTAFRLATDALATYKASLQQ